MCELKFGVRRPEGAGGGGEIVFCRSANKASEKGKKKTIKKRGKLSNRFYHDFNDARAETTFFTQISPR